MLISLFCLVGCDEASKEKSVVAERRSDIVGHWQYDIGDGVPHRMSILRDGTEILSIGQHDHGEFVVFIRYADDQKFVVVNPNGIVSIE